MMSINGGSCSTAARRLARRGDWTSSVLWCWFLIVSIITSHVQVLDMTSSQMVHMPPPPSGWLLLNFLWWGIVPLPWV